MAPSAAFDATKTASGEKSGSDSAEEREDVSGEGAESGGSEATGNGEAGTDKEKAPGTKARRGAAAGWAESGDTGEPDALPEYRASFERIATDSEGRKVQATGAMHLAVLQELQRTVYADLAELPSVGPAEDAWALFLRERWAHRETAK